MFERSASPLEIEALVVPDATLILLSAVIEPLRATNRLHGRELYSWRLVTPDGRPARTTAGVEIPSQGRFEPSASDAPLFVIASYNEPIQAGRELLRRLRAAGRRTVAGVESGVWLMARAGLLDGRAASVHWEDLEDFAAAFPQVEARAERFTIDDGRVTAGGAAPALDLMLRLIAARQGEASALSVARSFLYEPLGRSAGASSAGPVPVRDRRVAIALRMMEGSLSEPLDLSRIAAEVGVGRRRLHALFRQALGIGPRAYYLGLRLDMARRMMIETARPGFEVAERSGFASPGAFARAYRHRFGESPSATRNRARAST